MLVHLQADAMAGAVDEVLAVARILDDRSDKIGYKIREARQVMRVPYMLIIGAKEVEDGTVSVRNRDTDETTVMTVDELISKLREEISERRS